MKRAVYVDGDCVLYWKHFADPHGDCGRAAAFWIRRFVEDAAPDVAVVALDGPNNWRAKEYPDYKAKRQPTPNNVVFGRTRLPALLGSIPCARVDGYEADDVLASLVAREPNAQTIVISRDKDLQQLVSPNVIVHDPCGRQMLDVDDVIDKWGVPPQCLRTLLSISGDRSDNLDGVPGFGPATAKRIALPTLERTLDELGTTSLSEMKRIVLKQFWPRVERNYRLIGLKTDVPLA